MWPRVRADSDLPRSMAELTRISRYLRSPEQWAPRPGSLDWLDPARRRQFVPTLLCSSPMIPRRISNALNTIATPSSTAGVGVREPDLRPPHCRRLTADSGAPWKGLAPSAPAPKAHRGTSDRSHRCSRTLRRPGGHRACHGRRDNVIPIGSARAVLSVHTRAPEDVAPPSW
jgi:hypothetical protein